MRVIAGTLGGRNFQAPANNRLTHPMSEKAKGGLFNSLGDIEGLTFLDAFAGSGALSIEALSRGAKSTVAIDSDRQAADVISKNIIELGLGKSLKSIRANVSSWSDNNPEDQFDVVLADPPYDDLQLNLLGKLTRHVTPVGLIVLSWPGKTEIPELEGLEMIKNQNYGDIQLVFYRKIS